MEYALKCHTLWIQLLSFHCLQSHNQNSGHAQWQHQFLFCFCFIVYHSFFFWGGEVHFWGGQKSKNLPKKTDFFIFFLMEGECPSCPPPWHQCKSFVFDISLGKAIANLVLRLVVKIFSGAKIHAIYMLVCKNTHLSKNTDYWVKILIELKCSLGVSWT